MLETHGGSVVVTSESLRLEFTGIEAEVLRRIHAGSELDPDHEVVAESLAAAGVLEAGGISRRAVIAGGGAVSIAGIAAMTLPSAAAAASESNVSSYGAGNLPASGGTISAEPTNDGWWFHDFTTPDGTSSTTYNADSGANARFTVIDSAAIYNLSILVVGGGGGAGDNAVSDINSNGAAGYLVDAPFNTASHSRDGRVGAGGGTRRDLSSGEGKRGGTGRVVIAYRLTPLP